MQDIPAKEIITLQSGIQVEKIDGLYVCGDVILNLNQLEMLDGMGTRAYITNDYVRTWPNGVIYVDASAYSPGGISDNTLLRRAMQHWETYTDITFVERTNQPDYVKISLYNGMIPMSHLGRATGQQLLQITPGSTLGDIIHLLGHTVGLIDEHSRFDRDSHIRINPANTIPGWDTLYFGIVTEGIKYGEFDFGSIMLHSPYLYSFNGLPTMTKLDGTVWTPNTTGLSARDIDAVRYLYSEYTKTLEVFYLEGWNPIVKEGETRGIWAEYISPSCTNPRFNFSITYPNGTVALLATNAERTTATFNMPGVHRITASVVNDKAPMSNYIDIDVQAVQHVYPQLVTTMLPSTKDNRIYTNRVKFWADENFTIPITNFERNYIFVARKYKMTDYSSGIGSIQVVEVVEDDLLEGPASDYVLSNTYWYRPLYNLEERTPLEESEITLLDPIVLEQTYWTVDINEIIMH